MSGAISELASLKPDTEREVGTPSIEVATVQPAKSNGRVVAHAEDHEELPAQCRKLASAPNILDTFVEDLAGSGFVGEDRAAKLLYLAVTSRLFDRPISVAVKGPSSAGKSELVQRVLRFFPESTYYALTAMSERALVYSDEPLDHRFLVLYEAAGMVGGRTSYFVRSLLSEGRLQYRTVESTPEGLRDRVITREGPTGLISTTTVLRLHPERETRLFSIPITDTAEQTRAVLRALGTEEDDQGDLAPWHALQTWIAAGEHRITIPYWAELADLIPPVAVRLRRDIGAVRNLIKAHVLLHQANRERDAQGRLVAILNDYAVVRELVADILAEGLETTVSVTVREAVEAVIRLRDGGMPEAKVTDVAHALGLDKSAALRRVQKAIEGGYLTNLQRRRGQPARVVLGDPLPQVVEILPAPEALTGCTVAAESEGGGSASVAVNSEPTEGLDEAGETNGNVADETPIAAVSVPSTTGDDLEIPVCPDHRKPTVTPAVQASNTGDT